MFHLPVTSGYLRFDVCMHDPEISNMPLEPALEFVRITGSNGAYSKRKVHNDIISKPDGSVLGMMIIYFDDPGWCCFVNSAVLKPFNPVARFVHKREQLHTDLHMMTRRLFFVASIRRIGTFANCIRQPVKAMALQDVITAAA